MITDQAKRQFVARFVMVVNRRGKRMLRLLCFSENVAKTTLPVLLIATVLSWHVPSYAQWSHETVYTSAGRRYCGTDAHAYSLFGEPAIAFGEDKYGWMKYAIRKSSGWVVQTVSPAYYVRGGGITPSLEFDSNGNPGIVFGQAASMDRYLLYGYNDGTGWTNCRLWFGLTGTRGCLSFNRDDIPFVGGFVYNSQEIYRTLHDDDGYCPKSNVGHFESGSAMTIDHLPSDSLFAAYVVNGVLKAGVVRGNPLAAVDPSGLVQNETHVVVAPSGAPCVAYCTQAEGGQVVLASNPSEGTWDFDIVSNHLGSSVSLAFDPSGMPGVAYINSGTVWYCYFRDGEWHREFVYGSNAWTSSLAFSPTGSPSIAIETSWSLIFAARDNLEASGLWVDIVGGQRVRLGTESSFWLAYGNVSGEQTIDKAVILLTTTSNATISHSLPIAWSVSETYEENPSDSVMLIAYNLTPGSSAMLPIRIKALSGSEVKLSLSSWLVHSDYLNTYATTSSRMSTSVIQGSKENHSIFGPCPANPYPDGTVIFRHSNNPINKSGHMGIMYYDYESCIPYVWENIGEGSRLTPWDEFEAGSAWIGVHDPGLSDIDAIVLHDWLWQNSWDAENEIPPEGERLYFGACPNCNPPQYLCNESVAKAFRDNLGIDLIEGQAGDWRDKFLFPAYYYWKLESEFWPPYADILWGIPSTFNNPFLTMLSGVGRALTKSPELSIGVVTSWDPNEKIGLVGHGPDRFVTGGHELPYFIFFENDPDSSSASARLVSVTDTLDLSKYDIRSVSLGPIVIGEESVVPPTDARSWATVMDLPDGIDAGITVDVDTIAGILTWQFETLDSLTGLPPEDELIGFLPINVNPPEGEGHVGFLVIPWDTLSTGAELSNRASIVFDANPALLTPSWLNTIDVTPPTSIITELDSMQHELEYDVFWSGTDEGSDSLIFTVFVSDDGSPFEPWLAATANTSATFIGEREHMYTFYTTARDGAGNEEKPPLTFDAFTFISSTATDVVDTPPAKYRLHSNYPNPFNPSTTISYDLPKRSRVNLNVYDVSGRLIRILEHSKNRNPGSYSVVWDGRNNGGRSVSSGVYFYRIVAGDFVQAKKMVLIR